MGVDVTDLPLFTFILPLPWGGNSYFLNQLGLPGLLLDIFFGHISKRVIKLENGSQFIDVVNFKRSQNQIFAWSFVKKNSSLTFHSFSFSSPPIFS